MSKLGNNDENNIFGSTISWIKSKTKSYLNKIVKVTSYLKKLFEDTISSFKGWLKNTVNGFKDWCTNKINDLKTSLESKFQDIIEKIKALVRFLMAMIDSVSTMKRCEELSSPFSFLIKLLVDYLAELLKCCIELNFSKSTYEQLVPLIEEGKVIILEFCDNNWVKTLANDLIENPRVIFENLKTLFNPI